LRISRDDDGLLFEVDLPDTDEAESLATAVRRGDISQCSFAFRTLDDDWSMDDDGTMVRRLLKLSIDNGDVSAVTFPAYPETEVEARSAIVRGRERLGVEQWREAAAVRERALALAESEI
jgi:HK97 family phage prohead protease